MATRTRTRFEENLVRSRSFEGTDGALDLYLATIKANLERLFEQANLLHVAVDEAQQVVRSAPPKASAAASDDG